MRILNVYGLRSSLRSYRGLPNFTTLSLPRSSTYPVLYVMLPRLPYEIHFLDDTSLNLCRMKPSTRIWLPWSAPSSMQQFVHSPARWSFPKPCISCVGAIGAVDSQFQH